MRGFCLGTAGWRLLPMVLLLTIHAGRGAVGRASAELSVSA